MKNLFLILVIVCGFSLTVVSQETLYLEPLAPDGKIVNGRKYIPLSNEKIRQEMMQEMKMAPGEVANGFVYFPCQKETETLLFCFPIDEQEFQFVYKLKRAH